MDNSLLQKALDTVVRVGDGNVDKSKVHVGTDDLTGTDGDGRRVPRHISKFGGI